MPIAVIQLTLSLRLMQRKRFSVPFSAVTTVTNMTRDFGYAVVDVSVGLDEDPERVAGIPLEVVGLYYRVRFGGQPEDEAKLFQPFFTTKPVGQGTGLGLSVSYGIIDSLGGAIGYEPAPGGGAVFYFELPADTPAGA